MKPGARKVWVVVSDGHAVLAFTNERRANDAAFSWVGRNVKTCGPIPLDRPEREKGVG